MLDAAALAPTSTISLAETPVDAMAVSFYKMFGFPTGVGALVVREEFLARLHRPWFAGGTVDVVQAPGTIVTMTAEAHERFEVSPSTCVPLRASAPVTCPLGPGGDEAAAGPSPAVRHCASCMWPGPESGKARRGAGKLQGARC